MGMTEALSNPLAAAAAKPRLRGVLHQWAFFVSLVLGGLLLVLADDGRARLVAGIYAFSVAGLLGTSAVYHRVTWRRPSARRWMRRLDHSMIFVLIAGTYTPFAVLAIEGGLGTAILITVWAGAAGGIILKLVWIDAPKWITAGVYVALGWVAVAALPAMFDGVGALPTVLVMLGGLLYTTGAVIYATRRPDPVPTVFGYHELFHLLVVVAAALQYAVVAFWVL
jgi:hemolysin III